MRVVLYGHAGVVLLEGVKPEHTTLEQIREAFLTGRWRLDDTLGTVLAHPGGVPAHRADAASAALPATEFEADDDDEDADEEDDGGG